MNYRFTILTALWIGLSSVAVQADRDLSLTVYHDNYALVRDQREMNLESGVNEFRFTDVAATIEPSSVRFRSLTDPEARIVEQNFQYDLVSSARLMEKYVDRQVEILTLQGEIIDGRLLRAENNQIILRTPTDLRIVSRNQITGIRLAEMPEGLLTRPTLVWQMFTQQGGLQPIQLNYLARNIRWEMNYNAILSEDETQLDLVGWVTMTNNSGTDFPDANVSLIAGQPHQPPGQRMLSFGVDYLRSISQLPPSPERGDDISEILGDYRLYRLPERTDVNASQIKQVKLLQAEEVPVEKIYLYDGARVRFSPTRSYADPGFGREENRSVNVILSVENRADHNLGIALPPGLVRTFKNDRDDSLEFVGEDRLPPTSVNERILLYIGDAFDLVGTRTQTDFRRISERVVEEAFTIELSNRKEEPVTIMVIEKMYRWQDWEILERSHDYEKIDARTLRFNIDIPADQTETVTYRVRYRW